MKLKFKCGFLTALTLAASTAWADSLELKNGSLIKGKFLSGTATEISFQVGSTVQKYNVADIVSLKFDSEGGASVRRSRRVRFPTIRCRSHRVRFPTNPRPLRMAK